MYSGKWNKIHARVYTRLLDSPEYTVRYDTHFSNFECTGMVRNILDFPSHWESKTSFSKNIGWNPFL